MAEGNNAKFETAVAIEQDRMAKERGEYYNSVTGHEQVENPVGTPFQQKVEAVRRILTRRNQARQQVVKVIKKA